MGRDAKQWLAVVVVVFRGGKLLALRRAADRASHARVWEAVSGRVQADEDPWQAAQRELVEETGISAQIDPRPVDAYAMRRRGEPLVVLVYWAECTDDGEPVLSDEHDRSQWCTPDDFEVLGAPARLVMAARRCVEARQQALLASR